MHDPAPLLTSSFLESDNQKCIQSLKRNKYRSGCWVFSIGLVIIIGIIIWLTRKPASSPSVTLSTNTPRLGVGALTYFVPESPDYDKLPPGTIALINPNNGLFTDQNQTALMASIPQFQETVRRTTARGVFVIGYIPTGNSNHTDGCNIPAVCQTWNNINNQLTNYAQLFPDLSGIWFDEACLLAPHDTFQNVQLEYDDLRQSFYKYFATKVNTANPLIVFNPGTPYPQYPAAGKKDEIVIIFENSQLAFLAQQDLVKATQQAANVNGVRTWMIVNNASEDTMDSVVISAASFNASFVYVTNYNADWRSGVNTYGQLPSYWEKELTLINNTMPRQV
ncbi:UNVERIFIED_CONTAM: hypothetical protein HDU68_010823 [Siphonaria sp. JEL0065]|nr:hypothetical protein HDU68_010823 [Siphonaria sp. JEL0065]